MDPNDQRLLDRAQEMCDRAHAPYSRFSVGVALRSSKSMEGDKLSDAPGIYLGCNVENASSGLTICAERVAVASWVAAGRPGTLETVAIAARREDGSWAHAWPCGACRQVLQEFCSAPRSLRVLIWTAAGVVESRLADLLPDPFSPQDLLEGD